MRWPWQRRERRESGGDFADAVTRLIESTAAGKAADSGATAAVEAAAGALSRAFAAATVKGPEWAAQAVTPGFLGQVGRDLIRHGQSMHALRMSGGSPVLIPISNWHWEGDHDPAGWRVRATAFGPSSSTTWTLPAASVVFVSWGATAGQPYTGIGPTRWAGLSARLLSEAERSLADEAGGPIAQLLALPLDGGDGSGSGDDDDDPLEMLRSDIGTARGKALAVETTAAGWGEGRSGAPQRDWQPSRLGPKPPEALVALADQAYSRVLAACGAPPAMFTGDADGTSQRESLRRFHMLTVLPLARLLEAELSLKLDAPIRLTFDSYALDMVSRSQVVQKLAAAGIDTGVAMAAVGLAPDGGE